MQARSQMMPQQDVRKTRQEPVANRLLTTQELDDNILFE